MSLTLGQLKSAWPILGNVLGKIIDGFQRGLTNDQIRESISREDIVSDDALDSVRRATKDVEEFIRSGM